MGKQLTIPKLRFPQFSGKIETYKFDDIFAFSTGKNIKQHEASTEFETPCVRYGELYHMYDEVIHRVINKTNLDKSELLLSDGNEILLPSAGEDPLDIGSASALTIKNVAIGRTINILKPLKEDIYSQVYVSIYINHKLKKNISKLAKGVSISNVYNSDLKTLNINLPSLPEQKRIASFFTVLDKKISEIKQKKNLLELYKKGVMQKLFSQELRFKDENGKEFPKWKETKLNNICEINKGEQLNKELLSESGVYPCISGGVTPSGYTDKFNEVENTIIISEGGNSCGFVNFVKTRFWCGGHCYALKVIDIKSLNQKYLYQLLKFNEPEIMRLRVGSGLPNIQKKDILKFQIVLTTAIEEQRKISNFLSLIDDKINCTENQIQKVQLYKKGLLQNMFI
jgi:type I restriction enzyme S subunit